MQLHVKSIKYKTEIIRKVNTKKLKKLMLEKEI